MRVRAFIAAVVVTGVLLWLMAGCGVKSAQADQKSAGNPRKVTTAVVERSAAMSRDALMGTVAARNRADIQAKVQSRVERIPATLGKQVRKGELLAELDSRELNARVQQARAVYDQASTDLVRYDSLLARKVIAQQEFDVVKSRATVAQATLAEAEAMLSYTRIEAPFDGVVTEKTIDVGDLAVPGKPLFMIEEHAPLRFEVTIPESRRGNIKVGDSLEIAIPSADTTVIGKVEELSPSAEVSSRSFLAKIGLAQDSRIRVGQFGRLLLPSGNEQSIFIPVTAVVERGQLEIVYVVTPDNHAGLRLVRTGRQSQDKIEILSGLTAGERIVVSDPSQLNDGDTVVEESR